MVTVNCHVCNKGFDVYPSRSHLKYCSTECRKVGWSRSSKKNGAGGNVGKAKWVEKECQNCSKQFRVRAYTVKDGKGKYCSNECRYKGYENATVTQCEGCGKDVREIESRRKDGRGRFCSFKCRNTVLLKGTGNGNWKGGIKVDKSGYRLIMLPDHPDADSQGYVREHRLVMEQQVGRILTKKEVVHHINHVKDDNRPENLMLFASNVEHMRHHVEERKKAA